LVAFECFWIQQHQKSFVTFNHSLLFGGVSKMQETHGTSSGIHSDPSTSGVLPDAGIVVEIAL
jgi:hypothetical protein